MFSYSFLNLLQYLSVSVGSCAHFHVEYSLMRRKVEFLVNFELLSYLLLFVFGQCFPDCTVHRVPEGLRKNNGLEIMLLESVIVVSIL